MRKYFFGIILSLFSISSFASSVQEVQVKKFGDNLYGTKDEKIFIKTRYCYQSAYSYEDAILKIESRYGYNIGKLIFKDGKTCDVEKLYTESR
jgi:hypothetical protein